MARITGRPDAELGEAIARGKEETHERILVQLAELSVTKRGACSPWVPAS